MPRPEPSAVLVLLAALFAAGAADAAEQATPSQTLENVERAIEADKARASALSERAAAIAGELTELRQQMIAAAQATQEQEQQLTELEGTLDELRAAEDEEVRKLAGSRAQLATTLAALERLAIYPPEAIAALPQSPVDTVRGALLLGTALPEVEARARHLRADLESMRSLREQMSAEREAITGATAKLAGDRQRLAALVARKASLYRETEAERQSAEDRVVRLSTQAKDLRELMERVEAERAAREARLRARPAPLPAPPPAGVAPPKGGAVVASLPPGGRAGNGAVAIRPISAAEGRLTLPARGDIVKTFGDSGEFGTANKGITIHTRPGAQVVAPYDGQVVFAGPFRGYGQILIIEHSEGYHTLLSGLSRIDAVAGQWVLAGEPVGGMGQREGEEPELYVELRRNGRPINPLPWLALHNGKVSG